MKKLVMALLVVFVGVGIFGCKEETETIADKALYSIVVILDKENTPLGYGTLVINKKNKQLEVITSCSLLRKEYDNGVEFVNHPKVLFRYNKESYQVAVRTDLYEDICILTAFEPLNRVFVSSAEFNTFRPSVGNKVFSAIYILSENIATFNVFREYQIIAEVAQKDGKVRFLIDGNTKDCYSFEGSGVFNKNGKLVGIIIDNSPVIFSELNFHYNELED